METFVMYILAIRCGSMIIWQDGFPSCPTWIHYRIQDSRRIMQAVDDANIDKIL